MSTENEMPISLDIDLTGVQTKMPTFPKQKAALRVTRITKEENAAKTGFNMKVELQTTAMLTSTDGREIAPGFKLYTYIPLQDKEGGKSDYKVKIAELQEAALGEKQAKFSSTELIGKIVWATIKEEKSDEFGDSTKVGRLEHPKDN